MIRPHGVTWHIHWENQFSSHRPPNSHLSCWTELLWLVPMWQLSRCTHSLMKHVDTDTFCRVNHFLWLVSKCIRFVLFKDLNDTCRALSTFLWYRSHCIKFLWHVSFCTQFSMTHATLHKRVSDTMFSDTSHTAKSISDGSLSWHLSYCMQTFTTCPFWHVSYCTKFSYTWPLWHLPNCTHFLGQVSNSERVILYEIFSDRFPFWHLSYCSILLRDKSILTRAILFE